MIQLASIFATGFSLVFLLGFQSRNVNSGNFGWAAATSFLVAVAQATLWARLSASGPGPVGVVVYGLSGSTGITAAMWFHRRVVGRRS